MYSEERESISSTPLNTRYNTSMLHLFPQQPLQEGCQDVIALTCCIPEVLEVQAAAEQLLLAVRPLAHAGVQLAGGQRPAVPPRPAAHLRPRRRRRWRVRSYHYNTHVSQV